MFTYIYINILPSPRCRISESITSLYLSTVCKFWIKLLHTQPFKYGQQFIGVVLWTREELFQTFTSLKTPPQWGQYSQILRAEFSSILTFTYTRIHYRPDGEDRHALNLIDIELISNRVTCRELHLSKNTWIMFT